MATDSFVFDTAPATATDAKHKDWINIESMSSPVHRSGSETRDASGFTALDPDDGAKGPVVPVEDPDGTLWLCRENEEEGVCECIPW